MKFAIWGFRVTTKLLQTYTHNISEDLKQWHIALFTKE